MSLWKVLQAQFSATPGDVTPVRIDASTSSLNTVDFEHHQIHNGSSFTASRHVTHGAGASPNILIVTPNNAKWAHLVFQVISDDVVEVVLYEAPDYAGGGAMAEYNRDRNSGTAAGLVLTSDATNSGGGKGTALWTFKAGANKTVTTSESGRFEFILAQDEKYLIEAVGANGDVITMLMDWYEHENHN